MIIFVFTGFVSPVLFSTVPSTVWALLLGAAGLTIGALSPGAENLVHGSAGVPITRVAAGGSFLAGRQEDARVAQLAYLLATAGRRNCPDLEPATGLVLQHLSQFQAADRVGVVAALPIDHGPGVIVVAPDSPAATAGIIAGDILLAIDGKAIPQEPDLALPFDAARARHRADAITDLLQTARGLTVLRNGATLAIEIIPLPACPSRVHLARSGQRNAFADGRHVFLTTGVLALLRNDDEVAFLIAHEMAHNILGHAALMRSGAVGGRKGIRQIESAADRLGGMLMLNAGFDPVRGAALLRRLGGSDFGIVLLARHESPATRIAALQALVAERRTP
ncbi:M48 family metallopeptidase [Sphingomonas sp. GB1N7]|uniref:M48 family metallopeptidase n=1 Tax=Parasphingomonas caseinilytica TaxID=3096158 RepID=UPI002FC840DC